MVVGGGWVVGGGAYFESGVKNLFGPSGIRTRADQKYYIIKYVTNQLSHRSYFVRLLELSIGGLGVKEITKSHFKFVESGRRSVLYFKNGVFGVWMNWLFWTQSP